MKSKIFPKAGIISAFILLIGGILLISRDAKALLFGSAKNNINESHTQSVVSAQPVNNAEASIATEFPTAPSVVFKDVSGRTIDISKQKGKVLFINFWATWCPPCIQEMPSINKLKNQLNGKDILFLMVDVDDNHKKSSRFMENKKYNLPVYTSVSPVPPELFSGSLPTTIVIDKDGKLVGRHRGAADYMHPEVVKFFKELTSK